jgi:hypothetical protein
MSRRLLLLLPLAAVAFSYAPRADSDREVVDVINSAASGLSNGKPEVFLEAFDPKMPGYQKLSDAVTALCSGTEIENSIAVKSNQGDDTERTLELDWMMRIDRRGGAMGSMHRQETVKCTLRKMGKKWRIVVFDPAGLFDAPKG